MAQAQPDLLAGRRPRGAAPQANPGDAAGPAGPVRPGRAEEVHDRGRAGRAGRGAALMGYKTALRVWRGDAGAGELAGYQVEVNEGEVVLDVLHRPATPSSVSAELRGRQPGDGRPGPGRRATEDV